MEYIIEANNITKKYGNFKALNNLNINISKGDIYGLVGKNGAGKTTLIRILCKLEKPTSGYYSLYGVSSNNNNIYKELSRVGALIENPYLYYNMTAYDNLKVLFKLKGIPSYDDINSLLEEVGLLKYKDKKVYTYSLGMRQRLMIAMLLVGNPDILILDEPINGLDPEGIIEIRELLLKLNKDRNITILISSHYLDELSKITTKYGFIDKGSIIKEITSSELNSITKHKIILKIKNIKKISLYLEGKYSYEVNDNTTITIYDDIKIPKLINELVSNDIEVDDIYEVKETLESYYLNLLGGSND